MIDVVRRNTVLVIHGVKRVKLTRKYSTPQCVKCKETFMGNPVNDQQCYRKISVMKEFVIGKKTSETSEETVEPLPYGQAIFYAIYPRFTNVDIRMTIDVFEGSVDVFVADENDEFTVTLNETSGHHKVKIKSLVSSR